MKYLSAKDLIEIGFLQEANRQFFHPHGLALEVSFDEDGNEKFRVWDCREEDQGVMFTEDIMESHEARQKAANVFDEASKRIVSRTKLLGDFVQPIPGWDE